LDIEELKMRIGEKGQQSKERDNKASFLNVVENGDGMKGHQKYVGSQESIMSPVSTKMSINHCQNSFTLEEGSPRDCLHM